MPGPYIQPNPYGSYFSFGQPEAMGAGAFGGLPPGLISHGAALMAGSGRGGFAPTMAEAQQQRMQSQYQAKFLAEMMQKDPRVNSMTSLFLDQMSRSGQNATLNLFGGRNNLQEAIGWIMSRPGISGMLGGSPASMGMGAYAAATSGMRFNGFQMPFDGPLGMQAARGIAAHMNNNFFYANGNQNLAMTSGLNKDQLGGIMMLGAAQGAFAGLDMGTLNKRGQLTLNDAAMKKIGDFTKSAAKALSGLIDIYGDRSIAELAAKATQITGVNFTTLNSASLINNRLAALRTTGNAMGIDTQTMHEMSARSLVMGQQMGLTGMLGGHVAVWASQRGAEAWRAQQVQPMGFNINQVSLAESTAGLTRDMAAMTRDPIGLRRMAMGAALSTGHFRGAEDDAKRLMADDSSGSAQRMDAFMRRHGLDAESYIRMMGGPQGLQQTMSAETADLVTGMNSKAVSDRAWSRFRMQAAMTYGDTATSKGGQSLLSLMRELPMDVLEKLLAKGMTSKGEDAILSANPAGMLNRDSYKQLLAAVRSGLGDRAQSIHSTFQQAASTDSILKDYRLTTSDAIANAQRHVALTKFNMSERGTVLGGFGENLVGGLLDRYNGTDDKSVFARMAMLHPEKIIGRNNELLWRPGMDEAYDAKRAKAMYLMMGSNPAFSAARDMLGIKPGEKITDDLLQRFQKNLADPRTWKAMEEITGLRTAQFGSNVVFGSRSDFEATRENAELIDAGVILNRALAGTDKIASRGMGAAVKALTDGTSTEEQRQRARRMIQGKTSDLRTLRDMLSLPGWDDSMGNERMEKAVAQFSKNRGWGESTLQSIEQRLGQLKNSRNMLGGHIGGDLNATEMAMAYTFGSGSNDYEVKQLLTLKEAIERHSTTGGSGGASPFPTGAATLSGQLEVINGVMKLKDGQILFREKGK